MAVDDDGDERAVGQGTNVDVPVEQSVVRSRSVGGEAAF